MSRSGYSDDCDDWDLIRWRGAVKSAIKGTRGQQFLRELAAAMDAMPDKRLIANELQADGAFCTLGVIGCARGIDMAKVDPYDRETVASLFNVAPALAAEIMFENDDRTFKTEPVEVEVFGPLLPWEQRTRIFRVESKDAEASRWQYMRNWVAKHLAITTTKGIEA